MSLTEQVKTDMVAAMKAGEKTRAGALRLLLSELQKAAKDGQGDELAVLRREHKRRSEAAATYQANGREDLAAGERAEAALIDTYLPAQLDDTQLAALVDEAVAATGASSMRDMGAVIKHVMGAAHGQADGKRVSAAVKARLA
jgi:uncharacterized protein YqeY